MTGRILLLGLVLGVAGVAGASEARAFPVLEPARLLDHTMPDAALLPVGSERHGIHRGFRGVHKGFHGRRFHKGFHGHRLFAGKRLPHGGVFFRHRFVDPGFSFGLRFRHGDVFFRQRFADPGFLFGHRFGHGGSGLFLGDRFGHPPSLFDRHFEHRPSLFGRRFQHR
jgi:hypothetical protein